MKKTPLIIFAVAALLCTFWPFGSRRDVHPASAHEYVSLAENKATDAQVLAEAKIHPITNRQIGELLAAERGWTGSQWNCLEKLWTGESNWSEKAHNSSSGAHGIPQSLPGNKMASVGGDWATNPWTQIRWGLNYIKDRYGSPCGAYSFWQAQYPRWY